MPAPQQVLEPQLNPVDVQGLIGKAFKEQFFKPEMQGANVSELDSIKLTTMGISNELANLRQSMQTLNSGNVGKDAEIQRLQ